MTPKPMFTYPPLFGDFFSYVLTDSPQEPLSPEDLLLAVTVRPAKLAGLLPTLREKITAACTHPLTHANIV
jgi:hypothetical protein